MMPECSQTELVQSTGAAKLLDKRCVPRAGQVSRKSKPSRHWNGLTTGHHSYSCESCALREINGAVAPPVPGRSTCGPEFVGSGLRMMNKKPAINKSAAQRTANPAPTRSR